MQTAIRAGRPKERAMTPPEECAAPRATEHTLAR